MLNGTRTPTHLPNGNRRPYLPAAGVPALPRFAPGTERGGTVRAKSPGVGQGSTFTVMLPLAVLHEEEQQPGAESPGRSHPGTGAHADAPCDVVRLSGVTILVVDDEPDARELVRRFLTSCDARVVTAASADEALAALAEHRPDVLISDIGMPDVDGYELMRRVRSLPDDGSRQHRASGI